MKKINVKGPIVSNNVQWIYDLFDIEATSPRNVQDGLDDANGDDIEVEINSGGGSVFDGSEIYTALRRHKGNVTVNVVGLAASAASVIAMAGNKLAMSPTSQMMIHNASVIHAGDRNDMQHITDVLSNVDQTIANAYKEKSGLDDQTLLSMMDKETWLTPDQALDKNLIDEVMFQDNQSNFAASFNQMSMLPDEVINKVRNMKDTFYPANPSDDSSQGNQSDILNAKLNLLKLRKDDENVD
ncbi:head maturation protease, ClpP-related [Tuberibacillus sp. Marseille-P3662]|uniref:head maturation protease, ClpP-related n=1 Tax=Tuberibacillus sp. Marseille-P3662 TaxID=1965358 RepID=UPI000A1CA777|nr:head maturation protease, ClpP-related [Tuberibacillus sp. Marseille-P3662]